MAHAVLHLARRLFSGCIQWLSFAQVLIYLPLSLEVAGKSCFLSLSAALASYYFLQTTLGNLLRSTRLEILSALFGPLQVLAIPFLLLLFLNIYHTTSHPSHASEGNEALSHGVQWAAGALSHVPNAWETILKTLTPLFVILEGVSTLLVIQALGQASKYLIEERNESFQFVFLISSAATYVASAFFLYDSYKFAAATPTSATLIGVSLTTVIFLTGIAFALRKGNVVETSLMLAYLTFQIFYLTDGPNPWAYFGFLQAAQSPAAAGGPAPLIPAQLAQSLSTILSFFSNILGASLDFIIAAYSALPLPVMVGLAYRIAILYAAGQVVIALKRAQTGYNDSAYPDDDQDDRTPRGMSRIISYSRFILVSVYTHLLLINNQGGHMFWSWLNVFITLSLWAVELLLSKGTENQVNIVEGFRFKSE